MENKNEKRPEWYERLEGGINDLAKELGIDEDGTARMLEFVVREAKHQYFEGNRAGIYWMRGKGYGAAK